MGGWHYWHCKFRIIETTSHAYQEDGFNSCPGIIYPKCLFKPVQSELKTLYDYIFHRNFEFEFWIRRVVNLCFGYRRKARLIISDINVVKFVLPLTCKTCIKSFGHTPSAISFLPISVSPFVQMKVIRMFSFRNCHIFDIISELKWIFIYYILSRTRKCSKLKYDLRWSTVHLFGALHCQLHSHYLTQFEKALLVW